MFSVVIPLYNKREYILEAVSSALNQNVHGIEVLVIDDGSTDGGGDAVLSLCDPRVRYFRQRNSGVSAARNAGIVAAKHDLVAFLDADDYWEAGYLKEIAVLVHKCPDALLYATNFYLAYEGGRRVAPRHSVPGDFGLGYIDYLDLFYRTPGCSCLHTSAVVIRRGAAERFGYFKEGVKSGEDLLLWIALAAAGKVAYSSRRLVAYNFAVPQGERAIYREFSPTEFYVFHFSQLERRFAGNVQLIRLLDRLRLKNLKRFYATRACGDYVANAISEVRSGNWDFFSIIFYRLPPPLVSVPIRAFIRARSLLACMRCRLG